MLLAFTGQIRQFAQDVRYTLRALRKAPALAAVAVVSLALGIGANIAIFSMINALMLRPLPVRDPHQLVAISTATLDYAGGKQRFFEGGPMFDELRRNQKVFSSMFAWSGDYPITNFEVDGVRYVATLNTVSGEYFSGLGIAPRLGRLIAPQDVSPAAARVAVLGYRCWSRHHNADPAVIGKIIRINGVPHTIIGVTPKSFAGLIVDVAADVTVPAASPRAFHAVVGRLKPGVTLEQARAHLKTLWPGIQAAAVPPEYQERAKFLALQIDVEPAATGNAVMRQRLSHPLAVLMGLVGIVLLIACANLANLMLARAAGRHRELALRVALGAGRIRLIRLLLTESVTLALAGAALGFVIAGWTNRLLLNTLWTGYVPPALDTAPDLRVIAFAAAIALLTGVLFGLAPAWRVFRTDPASALGQRSRTVGSGAGIFGKLLGSAQVALSLVLVVGAMLFVRSLVKLRGIDPGFHREGVLLVQLFPLPGREKIPNRTGYYRQLSEKLAQLPGVESASYSHMGPAMTYEFPQPVPGLSSALVGPGFFRLMGVRLIAGREFGWRDDERSARVAILSESLARRLFPAENALGRKIKMVEGPNRWDLQIVGVVSSASLWKIQDREPLAVYTPAMQQPGYNHLTLHIRTAIPPARVAPAARRVLESMGDQFPLRIQTLAEQADRALSNEWLIAMLSASLGGLALLLASIGLYGLMAYSVTRRASEIGIRMALGAPRANVLRLILRDVLWMTLAGLAMGIPAALAVSRAISGMLYGVPPNDPSTMALSAAVLLGVALLAGYLPARRASRIDPIAALRYE